MSEARTSLSYQGPVEEELCFYISSVPLAMLLITCLKDSHIFVSFSFPVCKMSSAYGNEIRG